MRPLVLLLSTLLFACGGTDPVDETTNTNPPANNNNNNTADAVLELGKGVDAFAQLEADEALLVVSAPQTGGGLGFGQHVDIAVRAKNVDPQALKIHVVLDGATETHSDVTVQLNLVKDGDWYWGAGIRAVVDACFELVDQPLTLRVDIEDASGKTASETLDVQGPEACPRETG